MNNILLVSVEVVKQFLSSRSNFDCENIIYSMYGMFNTLCKAYIYMYSIYIGSLYSFE